MSLTKFLHAQRITKISNKMLRGANSLQKLVALKLGHLTPHILEQGSFLGGVTKQLFILFGVLN